MTGSREGGRGALTFRRHAALAAVALAAWSGLGIRGTEDAVANGDTRTLNILHEHTKESASITFKRDGYYDQDALKQLNWLLRDWRLDEPTRMEPRLFDIVWEVYREVGASEPIHVVSAYRSPQTNAMLRRRSKAVAEHSQHMRGFAMDFYLPDVPMARVREVGMRLQEGGVGFYPNAYNPFVHLDAGSVRSWPRMTYDQLARLFPDGRTVHLPRSGGPLGGYELAKAEILAKGGTVAGTSYAESGEESSGRKSLWATLFGGGEDEDAEFYGSAASRGRAAPRGPTRLASAANVSPAASGNSEDGGSRTFFALAAPDAVPTARLRRGQAIQVASATPASAIPVSVAPAPQPASPAPSPLAGEPVLRGASSFQPGFGGVETEAGRAAPTRASPLPPRRPDELSPLLAFVPLPPSRPVQPLVFAGLAAAPDAGVQAAPPGPRGVNAVVADDDRAALRALFDAAASGTSPERRAEVPTSRTRAEPMASALPLDDPGLKVRMEFSSATFEDGLSASAFRGTAIVALPVIR